jgi:DNA relaxase NicK
MVKYFKEVRTENGYIYSLDMLRLNLMFGDEIQHFMNWLSMYEESVDGVQINHYLSIKEFTFRDLFSVKTEDFSYSFAVGFNGASKDKKKGFIEFNPNKCQGEHFQRIWERIIDVTISVDIVRFDLAVDIPIPRYLVKLQKDNRNYTFMSCKGSDTEYLGRRNNVGYTKVYDKSKESDLEYELTRIEVTADLEGIRFPEVMILPLQEKFEFSKMSSTEKVLVQLLKQSDNAQMYLKQLARSKRKKLMPYIYEGSVEFSEDAYWQIRKQVLDYKY